MGGNVDTIGEATNHRGSVGLHGLHNLLRYPPAIIRGLPGSNQPNGAEGIQVAFSQVIEQSGCIVKPPEPGRKIGIGVEQGAGFEFFQLLHNLLGFS